MTGLILKKAVKYKTAMSVIPAIYTDHKITSAGHVDCLKEFNIPVIRRGKERDRQDVVTKLKQQDNS